MPKGRPTKSEIRSNIVEILNVLKAGYGYDIYRHYKTLFSPVTMRSIYYHLKKGTQLGEFRVNGVKKEKGNFSWGSETEKIYYELGPNAQPRGNDRVKKIFEKVSSL